VGGEGRITELLTEGEGAEQTGAEGCGRQRQLGGPGDEKAG
jgi:hypothetical protein